MAPAAATALRTWADEPGVTVVEGPLDCAADDVLNPMPVATQTEPTMTEAMAKAGALW